MSQEPDIGKLERIFSKDPFARSLGAELVELRPGYAKVRMKLGESHLNFLGFVHGGALISLMDYAFSAASNSHNLSSVAITMSVQFIKAAEPGSELYAEAREVSNSKKLGLYEMTALTKEGGLLAKCDGRVYRIGSPVVED